jgi:hypothetical protein
VQVFLHRVKTAIRLGIFVEDFANQKNKEEGGSFGRETLAEGKIPKIRRCHNESKNYNGMHRVQTTQLRHHQKQEEQSRSS